MDFTGKTYLVSGAGSGIGMACAELLLKNGALVMGLDITPPAIQHKSYIHHVVDVRNEAGIKALVDNAASEFKRIDGLINSAGVFASRKPFYDLSTEDWHRVLDTNLTGTFILSKYTAQKMIPAKAGSIINIGCIRSTLFRTNMADYAASKGGVSALTSAMALDLAPYHIRVNAIAPGFIQTGITAQAFSDPEVKKFSEDLIPQGRIGEPEDIAKVALFLLSDLADYMTGETVFVDGGYRISK
jgi:NAD(P)-dependent dehydrogenase (short-subunit alcohol dehydrogenase family)